MNNEPSHLSRVVRRGLAAWLAIAVFLGAPSASDAMPLGQSGVPVEGCENSGENCEGEIVIPGDPSAPPGETGSGDAPPGDEAPPPTGPTDGAVVSLMCARIDYGALPPGAAAVSLLNCTGDPPLVSIGLVYRGGLLSPYSAAVCLAAGVCQPSQTAPAFPCLPQSADDTLTFDCEFDGHEERRVAASSSCPHNRVERTPYPRSLVGVPTYFRLQHDLWGAGGAGGMRGSKEFAVGSDGNPLHMGAWSLDIAIRSQRLPAGVRWADQRAVGPEWTFRDGDGSSGASGDLSRFTWRHSSFGQPALGVGADRRTALPNPAMRLPAWEVISTTSCGHEVSWRYRVAETENIIGECRHFDGKPNDMAQICGSVAADGSGWYAEVTQRLRWRIAAGQPDFPSWQTVDLRWFGRSRSYATVRRAQDYGIVRDALYDSGLVRDSVWVPVLEAQSVLRSDACYHDAAVCPGVGR